MTSWLVDSSVLLASEDPNDDYFEDAAALLRGTDEIWTLDLAYYEVANVATKSWKFPSAARILRDRVAAVEDDGKLIRVGATIIEAASDIATSSGLSVYDAAYVAAAKAINGRLVSCDVRDLISKMLAVTPTDAVAALAVAEEGTEPVASDDADDEEPS
jgi:predicted nucleic acid-binding protein